MDDIKYNPIDFLQYLKCEIIDVGNVIRLDGNASKTFIKDISLVLRKCYVTDELLKDRALTLKISEKDVLESKLPDAGATMAGDFGEILLYVCQAAFGSPHQLFGPKKWRLKQDRTKPSPHSDVLHFILPTWPDPSDQDELLCSEVKTKSTNGTTNPIVEAIADSKKDRTSRLSKTLVWLKERAIGDDLSGITINHIDRFLGGLKYPKATKRFHAVAVLSSEFLDRELKNLPKEKPTDYELIVIVVPNLKDVYTEAYAAVRESVTSKLNS